MGKEQSPAAPKLDSDDPPPGLPQVYTSLSRSQLRKLQLLVGLSSTTSTLATMIYLPLLPMLRGQFHASAQAINLTLTVYVIFQAISPVIFGPLSDKHGRRILFMLVLALFALGSMGLAVSCAVDASGSSYAALLVLRAVQSLGASATGRMLGPIGMALNLGTCLGPVTGGIIAYTMGSPMWAFRAMAIAGLVLLIAVGLFLPQTARLLVGNGADPSLFKWWQFSWLTLAKKHIQRPSFYQRKSHSLHVITNDIRSKETNQGALSSSPMAIESTASGPVPTKGFGVILQKTGLDNLIECLRIIPHKDTILTLWLQASSYAISYCFMASIPDIFRDTYDFNEWQIGLVYLPRGIGIVIGSYCTGYMMDYNYRIVARRLDWTIDKVKGDDMFLFLIELARTRGTYITLAIALATTVSYGWTAQYAVHPAVLLVLQFLEGLCVTFFYNTYGTLIVDFFPDKPGTAAATASVTRCVMAAAAVAVLEPIVDVVGQGWFFTIFGLWSAVLGAAAVALLRWRGLRWRRERSGLPGKIPVEVPRKVEVSK
ncbi:hypothetical protein V498_02983 [Pseudogymnoascus sp. VKM F-4517 (FW-2822)]|nr:hypothetical protein V498_02983 [Pseudogymnoascus sp. VKM F-4517 (FW-2822)]